MANYYEWIKAFHIIFMTAWMVGMFYLPRLFCYHANVKRGSEGDKIFKTMEYRLQKFIMLPSMILTLLFGLMLAHIYGFSALGAWFYLKMLLVLVLLGLHGFFAQIRGDFFIGKNKRSPLFYKILNESVTVVFVLIVLLVILKPFEW